MLFPDRRYESSSSTAQTWMLAPHCQCKLFPQAWVHSFAWLHYATLVLLWDSVFVLRRDTVQELHRVAGGPEDQTLQDRGQRKPEEHPQLRLAQSLPEGQKSTRHHPACPSACTKNMFWCTFQPFKYVRFLCLVPAGCQLPVRRPGETGGFGLAAGPGC